MAEPVATRRDGTPPQAGDGRARPHPIVSAEELLAQLEQGRRLAVLDVRWRLGSDRGAIEHGERRIPGSHFVDLDAELSGTPGEGRHPLPQPAALAASMGRWGVAPGVPVVAYDDSGGLAAARCWWVLRWAGQREVQVLDGGLSAWQEAGGPLASGPAPDARTPESRWLSPAAAPSELAVGSMPVLDASAAAEIARDGVLLDARAAHRYRGEAESVDPLPGHIPGALSAPVSQCLDQSGRFLPPDQLRARFEALGATPARLGAYCGSGVSAAQELLALELAGLQGALYVGSWSDWVTDPARPRALGAGRG